MFFSVDASATDGFRQMPSGCIPRAGATMKFLFSLKLRGIQALAIIHAHPRTAIALSLSREEIIPVDSEGSCLLHKIPVLAAEFASGSQALADNVSEALHGYRIIMQRGHGCFAVGQTLEEAYHWVSTLEEASDIILEHRLLGEEMIEYRKQSESYERG
jgi:L-fuculose-phosphate aldolase